MSRWSQRDQRHASIIVRLNLGARKIGKIINGKLDAGENWKNVAEEKLGKFARRKNEGNQCGKAEKIITCDQLKLVGGNS
jgi:hypothetical protein